MKYFLFTAAAAVLLSACESRQSVVIESVAVAAGEESFAPQLFDANGRVSLSWLQKTPEGHALRFAEWNGVDWSAAGTVRQGNDWFANWADLPGVRPLSDGRWIAWWLQKSGEGTYAYDVQLAFSNDGEKWQAAGTPHDDGTQTEHGFVTAFEVPGNEVALAWLDGRHTSGGEGHAHHGKGGMTLRYGLYSTDGEKQRDAEVDALTCDCCQTDSAATNDAILLVYRDRTEAEIRDIYVTRYADAAWSTPVRVHADNWKIDGCPVNGPAVAADGDRVVVVWFTAPEGKGKVMAAFSEDGGRSFGPAQRIDDGRPQGRVDVVLEGERAIASWVEQGAEGAEIRLRVLGSGERPESISLIETDVGRAAGFPRMVLLEDGSLLLAWTNAGGDARHVESARIRF